MIRKKALPATLALLVIVAVIGIGWSVVGVGQGERPLTPINIVPPPNLSKLAGLPSLWGPRLVAGATRGKIVIVTFFASWCPPCREEFRTLQEVRRTHREAELMIIAVNLFENFDNFSNDRQLANYLKKVDPKFSVVKGDQAISREFGRVSRIPTLFVFDRQGRLIAHFTNARGGDTPHLNTEELSGLIARLI